MAFGRRGAQEVRFTDGLLDLLAGQILSGAALALGDRFKDGPRLGHHIEEHQGTLIAGLCVHGGVHLADLWLDWANAALNVCIAAPRRPQTWGRCQRLRRLQRLQ